MSRPETNDGRHAAAPTEAGYAQVAALATRLSALPSHGPLDSEIARRTAPNARSPLRFWLAVLIFSLTWLVTLMLGGLAALRFFDHDGTYFLTWVNAFTRYVYMPSYACLIIAFWKRRWWLAIANLAIVGCHLVWLAPDFIRDRTFDDRLSATAAAHPGKTVRIFFANVLFQNHEHAAMLQEIENANPDVVVLAEVSSRWLEVLGESPVMAGFPYGIGATQGRVGGVNVFSKLPLKSESEDWVVGRCIETLEIPLGPHTLRLVGLHAPRPISFQNNNYEGFWSHVTPLLAGARGPTVVVGDCNATQYSLVYERLKAGGLRSAHEDRGRGYAVSWPNGQRWLPPIRIDQAFLSSDVACLGIVEGDGRGSDHKPFILDVQVRDPSG